MSKYNKLLINTTILLSQVNIDNELIPADIIQEILEYSGDLRIKKETELETMYNTIYMAKCVRRHRILDNGEIRKYHRNFLFCGVCKRVFNTNSPRICFNHCYSRIHKQKQKSKKNKRIDYTKQENWYKLHNYINCEEVESVCLLEYPQNWVISKQWSNN